MKVVLLNSNSKHIREKRIQVVASAGNLSRADGTVTEVFKKNNDYEKNVKLARAVVGYGHKSIAEHDYITLALENVTPIIEQTIIGYRLTSFTIKSRRNVDFRKVGFYVPDFYDDNNKILTNNKSLKSRYKKYMQSLFDKYGELVDQGYPIEDCRYILPYSFYSNIIMGCDANEFLRITSDFLYGKLSRITEIKALGMEFAKIIEDNIPYLKKALENEENSVYYDDKFDYLDKLVKGINTELTDVKMTNYSSNADQVVLVNILKERYHLSYDKALDLLKDLRLKDKDIDNKLIDSLINSKNQRELEQVSYSFEFPISLAVLTHITRHRMHSLLVPDFVPLWEMDRYVLPSSLKEKYELEFKNIFDENVKMVKCFKDQGVREEDLVYFYLAGNVCNVSTTMNGRALEWISRMRCCNKAQWEIRNIVKEMVKQVKEVSPLVGKALGPSCVVLGICPEGKDSCKNRGVVKKEIK